MEENILSAQGRIRRSTFWTRWVIVFFINIILSMILESMRDTTVTLLVTILSVMLGIFMLLQIIKRMHDIDKSGWYGIIPIYNIVLAFTDGTAGPNQYGPDPKGRTTICPSCKTHNPPDLSICKNCGTTLYTIPEPAVSAEDSDRYLLIFLVFGSINALISFLIQTFIPNWYEGLPRYVTGGLSVLWGASLILLGMAIKNEKQKTIGIILASLWGLYIIVRNIMWLAEM